MRKLHEYGGPVVEMSDLFPLVTWAGDGDCYRPGSGRHPSSMRQRVRRLVIGTWITEAPLSRGLFLFLRHPTSGSRGGGGTEGVASP